MCPPPIAVTASGDPEVSAPSPDLSGGGAWLEPELRSDTAQAELQAEALRLHQRYQEEVVEAFHLCPWARPARLDTKTLACCASARNIFDQIDRAANTDAEVAFLIFPTYVGSAHAFEEFVARVIAADARRYHNSSPPFAMAAFHPEFLGEEVDSLTPETLVAYLRRSPNPTIQLVRLDALDRVRQGEPSGTSFIDPSAIDFNALPLKGVAERPSLRQRVASANHAMFLGPKGALLIRAVEAILEDRRSTFQRLGLAAAPWEQRSSRASNS